jgi:tRNA 2-thiouridine synthesizing protein D
MEEKCRNKCLTFALMDAPFESARTATAFRLLHAALDRGHDVNVFAYEGAVGLAFARQTAHPNAVHGRDAEQEAHPLSRVWIERLQAFAERRGARLQWINCGLCVDERGVAEAIAGVKRGSPADFWGMAQAADSTLVIATR